MYRMKSPNSTSNATPLHLSEALCVNQVHLRREWIAFSKMILTCSCWFADQLYLYHEHTWRPMPLLSHSIKGTGH